MGVTKLPSEVHGQLRASIVITSLGQLVEELVCNSIDAGAEKIQVLFDTTTFGIQVIDDGHGISRDSLSLLGAGHATSKLESLKGLEDRSPTLGFRGEALNAIVQCAQLSILSRTRGAQAYRKTFQGGKLGYFELASPHGPSGKAITVGTTVDVQDLFFNQPVKRRQLLTNPSRELEDLKERVLRVAFVYPDRAFELHDTVSRQRILHTPRVQSSRDLVECLFGEGLASDLQLVHLGDGQLGISGCISRPGRSQMSKGLQYLYINRRYVTNTPLHRILNGRFADTLDTIATDPGERYEASFGPSCKRQRPAPAFILNLTCPGSDYDITFEPAKSYVEFKDWSAVISFLQDALDELWGPAGFGSLGVSKPKLAAPLPALNLEGPSFDFGMEDPWFASPKHPAHGDDRPFLEVSPESDPIIADVSSGEKDRSELQPSFLNDSSPLSSPLYRHVPLNRLGESTRSEEYGWEGVRFSRQEAPQADRFFALDETDPIHFSQRRSSLGSGWSMLEPSGWSDDEARFDNSATPPLWEAEKLQEQRAFQAGYFPKERTDDLIEVYRYSQDAFPASPSRDDPTFLRGRRAAIDIGHRSQHGGLGLDGAAVRGYQPPELPETVHFKDAEKLGEHSGKRPTRLASEAPESIKRRKVAEGPSDEGSSDLKKRKKWGIASQRRPQSAPPYARPRKRYGPKSGASLQTSKRDTGKAADTEVIQASPEAAAKWRSPKEDVKVQGMYAAWRNPCFRAADSDVLTLETDRHPSIIPKEITRDMLEHLRVFQQLDRKFIAAVADNALVIFDQHATDERVRLEELRDMVLGVESPRATSSSALKEPFKMALTPTNEQVLRTHKRVIEEWGWRYTFEDLPQARQTWERSPGHAGRVFLTAVPQILDATLTAADLREYVQQLQDTRSPSSVPSSVIRLLNSKACRGAIMFGDTLLPGECLQLLRHLQRTQLPFQCAHGRPTMVPLVNMDVFARTYLDPDDQAESTRNSGRGDTYPRSSEGPSRKGGQAAAGGTAARGLFLHKAALSRARSRLERAEE